MKQLHASALLRVVFALLLAGAVIGAATGPSLSSPVFGKDKHGHGNHGDSHKPDKGKHKGHDKAQKDKKDKDKKHKNKDDRQVAAEPIALYTVRVDCTYDSSADETTCLFDADSPPGGKKINLLDVPAEEICATVTGGDGRYVDPDPNTDITGYRSTDSEGRMTLVLSGEVTTAATATYWIKAANNIFPATGPGLKCATSDTATTEPTAQTTPLPTAVPTQTLPEVTDSTGSVIVRSFACPIADPIADYDWYGECSAQAAGVRYRLVRIDTQTRDGLVTSTDDSGRARFASLQPGIYKLSQAEGDWCFAQSDNVDADGNLSVEAGNRTTVWVFACTGTS